MASGGAPKMKNGAPRDELKNGHGRVCRRELKGVSQRG